MHVLQDVCLYNQTVNTYFFEWSEFGNVAVGHHPSFEVQQDCMEIIRNQPSEKYPKGASVGGVFPKWLYNFNIWPIGNEGSYTWL